MRLMQYCKCQCFPKPMASLLSSIQILALWHAQAIDDHTTFNVCKELSGLFFRLAT